MKKKDKFKELAGDFENEAKIEEEADEEGLDLKKIEEEHFEEEESGEAEDLDLNKPEKEQFEE